MKIDSIEKQKQEQKGEQQQEPCEAVLQDIAESSQLRERFNESLTELAYASLYDEPEDGEPERSSPDPDHDR